MGTFIAANKVVSLDEIPLIILVVVVSEGDMCRCNDPFISPLCAS